jgi:hypothetical protein
VEHRRTQLVTELFGNVGQEVVNLLVVRVMDAAGRDGTVSVVLVMLRGLRTTG